MEKNAPKIDGGEDFPILSGEEVMNLLYSNFVETSLLAENDFSNRVIVADDNYATVDLELIINSINTDPLLSRERYKKDLFDCDDYVLYLKTKTSLFAQSNNFEYPLAVGFLLTKKHAFNFCVNQNYTLYLINTQSENRDWNSDITGNNIQFGNFLKITRNNIIQMIYL